MFMRGAENFPVSTGPHRRVGRAFDASVVTAGALLITVACTSVPPPDSSKELAYEPSGVVTDHPYVGMWSTADGRIRQELLPSGRYDEARGGRQSAYTGRYEVSGNHIDYWDDTGFTADGTFVTDNELHHGGMVFYRKRQ